MGPCIAVWEEAAEDRSLVVGRTKDWRFSTITALATTTSQVRRRAARARSVCSLAAPART
eukprot:9119402-Pyramimonas_sp.AAC.1